MVSFNETWTPGGKISCIAAVGSKKLSELKNFVMYIFYGLLRTVLRKTKVFAYSYEGLLKSYCTCLKLWLDTSYGFYKTYE